jgi:tetratricopeptide (TPR) repeat protein
VLAWVKAVNTLNLAGVKRSVMVAYIATVLAAGLISAVLLLLSRSNPHKEKSTAGSRQWGLTALLVGLFAMLAGGWSFWVTDLRLELSVPWDRFTQPLMLGTCLVIVGLLNLLIRPVLPKIILIAALAGVSAGVHLFNALDYRQEWIDQRTFFWQLAWRVPELEPGTLLLTSQLPFHISTDNSLTAAINWIYAPDLDSREMPFLMYDIEARLGNRLSSLDPGTAVQQDYRAADFTGSTNQSLVFYFSPPRCLKVLDLYTDRHYPNKPGELVLALPPSNQDLIHSGGQGSPQIPPFLGPEPLHNWCYYFEKVDLAVQLEQWERAVQLADQALKIKPELTQDNAPELIPLIYAYARTGRYDKAMELSVQAGKLSNKMHYYTCDTWYYLRKRIQGDPVFDASFAEIGQKFECSPP